ncbi:MAG: DUF3857 domain-containing protein, partial [Gammaproteobacteria bacterium]|nr:DUF3857 domain-containing protein [Gammaproteobacteria bacterium]
GDIVEYAFSVEYQTILMPEAFYTRTRTSFTVPVAPVERRIVVPEAMQLDIRYSGKTVEPKIEVSAGTVLDGVG